MKHEIERRDHQPTLRQRRTFQGTLLPLLGILTLAACSGVDGEQSDSDAKLGDEIEIKDGLVYQEGDMVLGSVEEVFGDPTTTDGVESLPKSAGATNLSEGFAGTAKTWTNGEVRWRFDAADFDGAGSVAEKQLETDLKAEFRKAVKHWSERSTVRFTEITNTSGTYINITRPDDCASNVGMGSSTGARYLGIGRTDDSGVRDCLWGNMMHELGHALGLEHESQRPDRESYIDLGPDHNSGATIAAADISLLSDYDVSSVMHYSTDLFLEGTTTPVVRNREALTYYDIQGAQLMYGDQLAPLASSPAGTAKLELFHRTTTGKVGHRTLNAGTWTNNTSRGAPNNTQIMGAPVALSRDGTKIELLALGLDKRIYHQSYNGTSWSAWAAIGNDTFRSIPAGVVRSSTALNVVAVDFATGALKRTAYDGSSWNAWSSLGGTIVGTPSIVSIDKDHLEIFALSTTKSLVRKSWTNAGGWESSWTDYGGTFRGVPTVRRAGDRVDIVAKNTDAKMIYRAYFPLTKKWNTTSWTKLNDQVVIGNPQFTYFTGILMVTAVGADQKLYAGAFSPSNMVLTLGKLDGTSEGSPLAVGVGNTVYAFVRGTDDKIKYKSITDNVLLPTWTTSFSTTGATVSW